MNRTPVILGGTFDTLHIGHEALLEKAYTVGDHVTIGLASDRYISKWKPGKKIHPFAFRKRQLIDYLKHKGWFLRTTILPLHDHFGPTISPERDKTKKIAMIIVSEETRPIAEQINRIRRDRNLPLLVICEVPMVRAQDGQPISATRIRNGKIDRSGKLVMPASLRKILGKPIGTFVSQSTVKKTMEADSKKFLITVGDKVTERALMSGIMPSLAIFDQRVGRRAYVWQKDLMSKLSDGSDCVHVTSGPGYISQEAIDAIADWAEYLNDKKDEKTSTIIIVSGEEDLLVLPALITAPLESVLYYGQPGKGMVRVEITEEQKVNARNLLDRFIG